MSLVVILPGPEDLGAGQVASAIRRGGAEVLVVPGPVLEAAHWEHRVADGQSRTLVRLPDGTVLDDASVGAVLNRLPGASVRRFAHSPERDRSYAAAEWEALVLAWLSAMGERVIGCPTPAVISLGPSAPGAELRWLAWGRRCGLLGPRALVAPHPVWLSVPPSSGPIERWTVVGPIVLRAGVAVDEGPAQALRSLAKIAGVDLLDVTLRSTAAGDELVAVDLRPALTPGIAEALAGLLLSRLRATGTLEVAS